MWRIDSRIPVLRNPFVQVTRKLVYKDGDGPHDYYSFEFRDFCNVVPVTADGRVVLVRQFRVGLEAETLEAPGGIVDPSDLNPKFSAVRELKEETGYAPSENARIEALGWVHPNPAVQANRCHFFVAGPVEKVGAPSLDPLEHTEVELVPIDRLVPLILEGRITHSLVLNAFHYLGLRAGGNLEAALNAFRR